MIEPKGKRMTDTQTTSTDAPIAEALDTATLIARYDAIIDEGVGKYGRHVRPEDRVTQRSMGHDLIARIASEGLEVTAIDRDPYDRVDFTMRSGVIRQMVGDDGFEVQPRTRKGQLYKVMGSAVDAEGIVRMYVDEVVPEAIVATRLEEDDDRKRRERTDALKAEDDAIIAAYEGLPEEMRKGFKAMLGYVALMERRNNRGFHGGGPPIANMLLMNIDRAESGGMPDFDPSHAGRAFHW